VFFFPLILWNPMFRKYSRIEEFSKRWNRKKCGYNTCKSRERCPECGYNGNS
jgi:hypothetical protein